MGKKKSKELDAASEGDTPSSQPDIFKTLFGNAQEQNADVLSLFSDSNPFKRKPQEPVSESGSTKSSEKPNGVHSLDSDNVELKQRKRKKDKVKAQNPNLDSTDEATETEIPLVAKKSKKDKHLLNKEDEENPVSPPSEKGRKKRKRDDLEKEYETKKYGAAAPVEEEGGLGGKIVGQKRKKADDDGEDALAPKEGFDDESKLLRTVFVGNLPLKIKKKVLIKEFSKFGEVESVRIRSIPLKETKKPRKGAIMQKQINENADSVNAYVVFKTEQSAEASLAHNMNVVAGNHIRVDRACPPRKKLKGENALLYDNTRTVFVGNLPFDVKDEEIYQLFCSINNLESSIEAVRVVRDPQSGVGRGIAYVLFKTREAANMVIRKRTLVLRERELRLSHARADSIPSKRKNPSGPRTASSPGKGLAVDSKTPDKDNRSNKKASVSYQGLHASRSGVQKKAHSSAVKFRTYKGEKKPKERLTKRPAVSARKAKLKAMMSAAAGDSKQAGIKRKSDSRTPDIAYQKKKAKMF